MGMRLMGKTGVELGHIWRCLEFAQDGFSLLPLREAKCLIPMASEDDLIEDFLSA